MRDNIKREIQELRSVFDSTDVREDSSNEQGGAVYGSDIYAIFDNLHNLFSSLKLLSDNPKDVASSFKFIHAYPDEVKTDDVNIITFRVKTRAPQVTNNRSNTQSGFTSKGPRSMHEGYNQVSGMYENHYQQSFDNVIALNIFSTKARAVNLLAQILESIFVKYRAEISPPATQYHYLGMSDVGFLDRYDQEPIFTRELGFHFVTSEVFIMETEKVKSIQIGNDLI